MADQLIAIIPSFSLSDSKSEYVPVGPPGGTPIKWYSELDVTLTFINPSIFKKQMGLFMYEVIYESSIDLINTI
ncbi:hypothetical protein ACLMAB_00370 [Brevibacillus laterosporus]